MKTITIILLMLNSFNGAVTNETISEDITYPENIEYCANIKFHMDMKELYNEQCDDEVVTNYINTTVSHPTY